jgi:YVTN family beta-propeller protein
VISELRRGATLAGYRIEALLGRGGMGVVYLATDLHLERKVALKLITPELAADPRFCERFLREARLAASLDHSHIVPVYEAGDADGQLFQAMRYVDGEDLATLLRREAPLEAVRALELVAQIGEALDAAHEHRLVHRDVKPANVLVTREGGQEHCYLADFGLARSGTGEADATATPHLSGTVDYTSPEQIEQQPADARADIYSLGCVFFECLAGEPPFQRPRAVATLFAHTTEPPPSLHHVRPELPEDIDAVLARALAKDPDGRYASCRELVHSARGALGLAAKPRMSRRRVLALAIAAAVAVTLAASVPVVLLSGGDAGNRGEPRVLLPLTEDSLVRIDPATGNVSEAIALGSGADALAVGEGSVWVVNARERLLSRIDPQTNTVVNEVDVSRAGSPEFVAAGEGAVWLGRNNFSNKLWRYDIESGSLTAGPGDFSPNGVAVGGQAVWISTGNARVVRIRPATGEVVSTTDLREIAGCDCPAGSIAVGEGGVWLAGGGERVDTLFWLDPDTGSVITTEIGAFVSDIAVGEGAVWVTTLDDDAVLRIDPATKQVVETISVGRIPSSIAIGAGFVWVTSSRDGTVIRVDPTTSNIETIDVGGIPTDIAAGPDGVWVTVGVR